MSSLYVRATPSQRRILRAVEGAFKNACDAHPGIEFSPRFARSVAKRAAGTLTAQWPDVLAASAGSVAAPPDKPDGCKLVSGRRHRAAQRTMRGGQGAVTSSYGRAPLRKLHAQVSMHIGPAKKAGNTERVNALIEVCRMIAARLPA